MIQDRQQVPFSAVPAAPRDYVCIVMHTIQAGDTLYSISHRYNVTVSALMQANDISNPYDLHVGRQICIPREEEFQNETSCNGIIHTIVSGDTPYMLSKHYNVPLEAILQANPAMDPHNLRVGDRICIPGISEAPVPAPPSMPAPIPPAPAPPSMPAPIPPAPAPPSMPAPIPPARVTPSMPAPIPPLQPIPITPQIVPGTDEDACSGEFYTVVEGDTLYMIAKRNGISLDVLLNANQSADLCNLEVGMKLCIPAALSDDCYFVRIGDNMDRICDQFKIMPRNLMKVNPEISVTDYSIPGTRICIPSK